MQAASVVCPRVILKSGQVHSAVRAQQSSEVGRQADDASQANYLQIETWIALGVNDLRVRARACGQEPQDAKDHKRKMGVGKSNRGAHMALHVQQH